MAWRNVWRNRRRSLLTIAALAFSCVLLIFMLSWQFGAYDAMIESAVNLQTGPMQVLVEGYNDDPDIRETIRNPAEIAASIRAIPRVGDVTLRAEGFALVSSDDRSYGVQVLGIDPRSEYRVSTLHRTLQSGRRLQPDESTSVVIGSLLARNLRVGLGGEIVLLGQGYDGSVAANVFQVTGIFETGQGEIDRNLITIPLATFQETFSLGDRVHRIVIVPTGFDALPEVRRRIEEILPGRATDPLTVQNWDALIPGLKQSIELDKLSAYVMYFFLLVVVAFSIANAFLMAVLERTREFGILRAIGTTPGRLTRLLFLETALLAAVGIAAGLCLGLPFTALIQQVGVPMGEAGAIMEEYGMPARMHPKLTLASAVVGPLFVWGFTFLSALPPILRVRRLKPVEAIASRN